MGMEGKCLIQEWEDTDIHTICMDMASLNTEVMVNSHTAEAMGTDIMVDMAMVMADTGMDTVMVTARAGMVMAIMVDMAKVGTVKAGMVSKGN